MQDRRGHGLLTDPGLHLLDQLRRADRAFVFQFDLSLPTHVHTDNKHPFRHASDYHPQRVEWQRKDHWLGLKLERQAIHF